MQEEMNDFYKKSENNNELIIMYPEEQLENIINKLKDFGFVETEKNRIDLGNKIIANLRYEGKISFENTIDKIKEQGIEYEIPAKYNLHKNDKSKFNDNYLI